MEQLKGVQVLWLDGYDTGPIAGVALYNGTEHYFKAVFDEARDEWTDPRRFLLYAMDGPEIAEAWEKHRFFEEKASTRDCFHEGRSDPVLRPEDQRQEFYNRYPPKPQEFGSPVGYFFLPLEQFRPRRP